jgi:hypothetical protein
VAQDNYIDLLRVRENGSAVWMGRVDTLEEARSSLNQLSASYDDHFLAVERSSAAVVAHVMGRLPQDLS